VAKNELGTKRTCPETGKKFYDLGKDPIVSPYTGIAYPLTAFEQVRREARVEDEEETELETAVAVDTVEFVPLEDADADEKEAADDIPDLGDDDVDLGDDDADDTFLEEEEEDDDNMADILGGVPEGEDEV
jgi:uncharacterized protein (TIGR02300 family)